MKKTFIVTALALGMTVPVYAAQFDNSGDKKYMAPSVVEDPNAVVAHRESTEETSVLPITITGEHASYDNVSGDFYAEGNVKVNQGSQDIYTTKVRGNMKTGDIWMEEGGYLEEGNSETAAEWGYYNFNSKTGELKKVDGKNGKDFYKAPHAVIDPEKITLDEGGTTTRCPAVKNTPCLEIKAKTFEIYPKQKMIARDVQVFVKGKHVYSRDVWENDISEGGEEKLMPRFGYDNDNGAYIRLDYERPLSDKTTVFADLALYSDEGYRPLYGLRHNERNFNVEFSNGWEEEDDDWVKKQTNIRFNYKPHHFSDKLPLSYSFYGEHGLWKNDDTGKRSWHTEYGVFLNHDRIYLFNSSYTTLDLTVGKKWTKESLGDTTESTDVYYATLGQQLTDKWRTWVGYYKEDFTSNVFDYGQPDMETELRNGVEYKFDDKNSISVINRYDLENNKNYETDYRFVHRFCCWQIALEYEKEHYKNDDSWTIKYEFVNW